MKSTAFLLHALSPLHAGTGQAVDVIDLPTARMKATGIPLPGSSIKGVLRDARNTNGADTEKLLAVFGPKKEQADHHAGALVVGDARLLALPVRSFRGTFAWTTSPLLLTLAKRDLEEADLPIPSITGRGAQLARGNCCVHQGRLCLEDLDLPATESNNVTAWVDSPDSPGVAPILRFPRRSGHPNRRIEQRPVCARCSGPGWARDERRRHHGTSRDRQRTSDG